MCASRGRFLWPSSWGRTFRLYLWSAAVSRLRWDASASATLCHRPRPSAPPCSLLLPVRGISRRPNDFEMSRGSRRRRPARRRRSRRFPETVAERGRLLERCSRPHSGRLSVLRRRQGALICSSLCPAAGHGIAFERWRVGGDVSVSPSRLVSQSCMKHSLVDIRRVACRDDMPRIS